ncbi:MAG: PadR family transcriptional regulator [Oscillospiraceae bacterium]|nr:PadR family transcriptional regulator [Oscillospiraceae bacterium]
MVSRRDCYGDELVNQISASMQITEGTIYPLLKRLKDQGSINSYIVESQEGPPRKYYTITQGGESAKQEQVRQWREFSTGIDKIINKDGGKHE